MPMKTSIIKMTWRSIKNFKGRYMALLLIVALSAGFFSGLKVTKSSMANTCDNYLYEQHMYDFRLMSTLGFTKEDIDAFEQLEGVMYAEGIKSVDAMLLYDEESKPYKVFMLPKETNLPSVTAGRLPQNVYECLVDDVKFTKDDIGKVIKISDENSEEVESQFTEKEYTIVGIADSPIYMGLERGTTSIGSGALSAFIYVLEESFKSEIYTEINLVLEDRKAIYSKEYDELIERYEDDVTTLCNERAGIRYESILKENGLTPELAVMAGIEEAEVYILTRNENAGYVSFENDTSIISGIANIFPIFFILIAMLVCMTTMTRMVDEERTQIGVLKAMGYSNAKIMAKYMLYAGSATTIGWAVGFFLCTWGLPEIFWLAYNAIYDFAPMEYLFSIDLALITLVVSLAGILGSAFISCRKELMSVPAKLIRPRAAKNGKRVLIERISPLWKRLSFLHKITLRNMFRYKRRFIMMLIGISCSGALVVTGFGVRDSMIGIGKLQFETVQLYDMEASFEKGQSEVAIQKIEDIDGVEKIITGSLHRVDIVGETTMNSVSMMSFKDLDKLSDFWDFHAGDKKLAYPKKGEAIINIKIADKLGLKVGDTLELRDADMRTCVVEISGIFDNYIFNFVLISDETYEEGFEKWQANTAYICANGDIPMIAENINGIEEITSVTQMSVTEEVATSALSCLDYIILLIVVFSGALAFIVIFNLTNINIAERSREIATVEVLGFYQRETESYVLRENLVLSVIASFIGLPLGIAFHRVVMNMVLIDALSFDVHIEPISYVIAFICTVLFAVIVNLFMKRHIAKINMTESLKAVE